MNRPTFRRSARLEVLESREVMSSGGPSAEAQYMLEMINQARTNPRAAAEAVTSDLDLDIQATLKYYNVDLNSTRNEIASVKSSQPVAWSDKLVSAAIDHSADLARTGVQSHTGSDGSSPGDRLNRVGYANRTGEAENVYSYSESVEHAMQAFLIDWGVSGNGHRNNILQPNASADQQWDEVGIGIIASSKPGFGPKVITQQFGSRSDAQPFLLGVAFNDDNGNGSYDMYEGQGDVKVEATNVATGMTKSVDTWDEGGGYQIPLDPGTYQVTAKVGNRIVRSDRVSIGSQNVKVDYNLSTLPQVVAAPAPAPTLVPTPPTPSAPNFATMSNVTASVQTRQATTVAPTQSRSSNSSTWIMSQAQIAQQELVAPKSTTVPTATTPARSTGMSRWSSWSARRTG